MQKNNKAFVVFVAVTSFVLGIGTELHGALWRVKSPGAVACTIEFAANVSATVWDCAGNLVQSETLVEGQQLGLLGVSGIESDRVAGTVTVDGDGFYVELPDGMTARQAIKKLTRVDCDQARYGRLAARWAPCLFQDEDDSCRWADWITAIDFDGDYCGTNNWDNAGDESHAFRGSLLNEAVLYWWVVETSTHYVVGYADFHPRDWNDRDSLVNKFLGLRAAITDYDDQHENDLEGAIIVLRKSDDDPDGLPELMMTQAHNDFWQYSPVAESLQERHGREDVDGPIQFVDGRPSLYIEAKGHGVYGSAKKTDYDGTGNGDGRTYRYAGDPEADFLAWPVEKGDDGQLVPRTGHGPSWLRRPADGKGRLPVDYSLRSIASIWDRRHTSLFSQTTEKAAFRGAVHGDDAACPPWGWIDKDYAGKGLLGAGDTFFHEPAVLYGWLFDCSLLGPLDQTVIGRSYATTLVSD